MKSKNKTNNNNENQNSGNITPAAGVNVAPAVVANIAPVERRRRGRPIIPDPHAYEEHCEYQKTLEKFKPLVERTDGYQRWIFQGLIGKVETALQRGDNLDEFHKELTNCIQRCREIQPEFAFFLHFVYGYDEAVFRQACPENFANLLIMLFMIRRKRLLLAERRAHEAESQPGSGGQSLAKS